MKNDDEKKTVSLPSYQNIWNYDKRIYTLFDMTLPTDISISEFCYFLVIEIVVILLNLILHVPQLFDNAIVSWIIKFAAIPFFSMRMLKYNKLDGKFPVSYFKDYIVYFFNKDKQYEFFREVGELPEKQEYIIQWQCSYRHRLRILPKTRRKKVEQVSYRMSS